MKTVIRALTLVAIMATMAQAGSWWNPLATPQTTTTSNVDNTVMQPVKENAYGLGVHSDSTGRAVTTQPAYGNSRPGEYNNSTVIKENGYGYGVHIDQYGRPVTYK